MTLSTQPYKGARDFYPEDKRLQKYMFGVMRDVVGKFGYEEYDAPVLEPIDLFLAKTGEEIVNEQTYVFEDRGGRKVTLRPEMTPSVSRMVAAKRQELVFPLRWYSIPNLWRYERPQRGRLREHWQLNVDLFGVEGLEADHEIIQIADALMQTFKAKRDMYTIRLNSRKLTDDMLRSYLGLTEVQAQTMTKLVDRKPKMDHADFVADVDAVVTPSQREAGLSEKLMSLLEIKNLEDLPAELKSHQSVGNLQQLVKMLSKNEINNAEFDSTLMRGFDYYTDIVFEVFDNHPENNRSMFGGGRYDGLIELFGVEPVPTVGFGMGDVTLQNFLDGHKLLPQLKAETELYAILIGDVYEQAQPILSQLREMGVKVALDFTGRKADKQIKTATKKDIQYALFIGPKELAEEQYTLKNLTSGEEERHSLGRLVSIIKDYRHD